MIDATKLKEWGNYYIKYKDLPYTVSYWDGFVKRFVTRATEYKPYEVTDAIPIPTPEKLEADAKELAELRSDHAHALAETKRRLPDYPFTQNTMSECVWALGESLIGTERAIEDWQELVKQMREVIERAACGEMDTDMVMQARTLLEKMT